MVSRFANFENITNYDMVMIMMMKLSPIRKEICTHTANCIGLQKNNTVFSHSIHAFTDGL